MPTKLPIEKIIKIRREIKKGKSRRQLAKDMNLSVDTVCKYGKHINPGKINDNLKNIIREEVISGKTKKLVAQRYAVSYYAVGRITKDIKKRIQILPVQKIKFIRKQVRNGKTKKQVSFETGIPYYRVLKLTKDIISGYNIPDTIKKKIKDFKQSGKSDREIAEELNISETSVKIHSVNDKYLYCKYTQVPGPVIEEIRSQVKSGKDKLQVAKEMQVSYTKVKRFTKDLRGGNPKRKKQLSKETINKIRKEVKSGKTKIQVSRELNISLRTVYSHTLDIIVGQTRDFPISAKTFDLLEEIIKNGYALQAYKYNNSHYQELRLKFPNIKRVKIHGRVIYFLEDKADLACKVFLKNSPKKITNYHELKQVVDVFKTQMKKEEKKQYISKI